MERTAPESVGDVLRNLLEETSLKNRMEELKAVELWAKVCGDAIASVTRRPSVKNGIMTVGVPNPSLRNELSMHRSRLCELINQHLGKQILKEIKFVS